MSIRPGSDHKKPMMTSQILAMHIGGGSLALVSGLIALGLRKGAAAHRAIGTVFVLSMLTMAVTAAYLAIRIQNITVFGAVLTIYLIATGLGAARQADGKTGSFEIAALLFAVALAVVELICALQAATSPTGLFMGYSRGPYLGVTIVASIAAAFDLKVIVRGGISGAARIARHLWRMCLALFIAATSFLGQGLKTIVLAHPYLLLFALTPLVLMIFWLIRVRLTKWYAAQSQQVLLATPSAGE